MSGIGSLNRVKPKRGELLHAAVTASTAGTANALLTADSESRTLMLQNLTDVEVMITLDGVDFWRLPTNSGASFDFGTNGSTLLGAAVTQPYVLPATVVGVYYTSGAPTSGGVQAVSVPTRKAS